MRFGSGQAGHRVEDWRFLTGRGRFQANSQATGALHMVVVRSPHAHADIAAIDTAAAWDMHGVVGILTGRDLAEEGIGPIPCGAVIRSVGRRETFIPPFDILPTDRVRFVGQAVAAVIAESRTAALDAAEAIEIAYSERPAAIDPRQAVGQPPVWEDAPDNVAMHWQAGDHDAVDRAFAAADRVVTLDLVNNRISANPMEPRAALGEWDAGLERLTLYTSSQGPQGLRETFAGVLGIPEDLLRVVTGDVGGSFGMKGFPYVEQALVLIAARRFGRPVAWVCDRAEALQSDYHARDHRTRVELAMDADHRFRALRVDTLANVGAFLSSYGLFVSTDCYVEGLPGAYELPDIAVDVRAIFTNTGPTDAYRGAGRAEGTYALERVIDAAARDLGVDPLDLRRANLLTRDRLPWTNALGNTYDSGAFTECLDNAASRADWSGFADRRAVAVANGRLRGIGLACGLTPVGYNPGDIARIGVDSAGHVQVTLGNMSCGQGHETSAVRIVAAALAVDPSRIRVVQGDTDRVSALANSNGGSNFLQSAGPALHCAAAQIIDKGRRIAAHLLEAGEADITFADGAFSVTGTDCSVVFADVAAAAWDPSALPDDLPPGWDETHYHRAADTYPFGTQIAEVEVCPETGSVEIAAFTVVSDFGTILNPDLVAGQVHGGLAQGLGQALCEECAFDADGQPLNGSFMDYAMPRADLCPTPALDFVEEPTPTNALGVKGCGEVPTAAASPAVINAILDALAPLGVGHIDMPATPHRVWQAIRDARPQS